MIFYARQIRWKSRERQKRFYLVFYDLKKSLDTAPKLSMLNVLDQFISVVQGLYSGMSGTIFHQNQTSPLLDNWNKDTFWLRHSPTCTLLHELSSSNLGANIRSQYDGRGFNLARLKSRLTRNQKNAAVCHSSEQLQKLMNNFTNAYTRFSLKINIKKTKILAQSVLSQETPNINITIAEIPVEFAFERVYIGKGRGDPIESGSHRV